MDREPQQAFFQRKQKDCQQAHKSIKNYQGNANQNHSEISPHTSQNVNIYYQKKPTNNKWRKVNSCALLGM